MRLWRIPVNTIASLLWLLFGGCGALAAQDIQDWTRFDPSLPDANQTLDCAATTRTGWVIAQDGESVALRPVGREVENARQDPLPYEIEWHPAMLGADPPEPMGPTPWSSDAYDRWARRALPHTRRVVLLVEDGWLLGIDAGEYGGSLWWFPAKRGEGQKLHDGNVRLLVRHPRSGRVLALLRGSGFEREEAPVFLFDDEHHLRETTRLPFGPRTTAPTLDGNLLVAGDAASGETGLAVIDPEGNILAQGGPGPGTFWGQPQSVLQMPSGEVYIGLQFFVARLRPTGPTFESQLYVPPGCARHREARWECVCDGCAARKLGQYAA